MQKQESRQKIDSSCKKSIDAVIAYVDGTDLSWQKSFAECLAVEEDDDNSITKVSRFRSYGTLGLQIQCIRKFMPFIDNVYVVVSQESQIPAQLKDDSAVKFILHSDIIPEKHLPVFNSQAIEVFLHRIDGLKDKFIYFNDDMFPVRALRQSDFFADEKPVWRVMHWNFSDICNSFRHVCLHSFVLASQTLNKDKLLDMSNIIVPEHSISPMFREDCEFVYMQNEAELDKMTTKFRKPWNVNQYLYSVYSLLKRGYVNPSYTFKYIALKDCLNINRLDADIVCINDVHTDNDIANAAICRLRLMLEDILQNNTN